MKLQFNFRNVLPMPFDNNQYFSKTIEKGLSILNLFDRDHPRRSLSEISKITGINKTSTYRFVDTLITLGYLNKNQRNKSLKLGPQALVLGQHFIQGFEPLQGIKPVLDKTFIEYQITIDSALLYDRKLISLYRRETPNIINFRLPLVMENLYARAMGKIVLASFSKTELNDFFKEIQITRLTEKTVVDRKKIMKGLELAKSRGYAINDEEYVIGLRCVAAPLRNFNTDKVIGAISFDFPSINYTIEDIDKKYTGLLTRLANDISEIFTASEN